MKIVYLKSITKALLIADIAKVVSVENNEGTQPYNGEIEFSNGIIHVHYIGKIAKSKNELGEITEWLNGFHANLLVPKDFDETIFSTRVIPPPNNPVHTFA
jgi:hypothetical protein